MDQPLGRGFDIHISSNYTKNKESYSNFPYSYQHTLGKGKSVFTINNDNSNWYFRLKEVEIFKLFK